MSEHTPKGLIRLTDYDGGAVLIHPDAIRVIRELGAEQTCLGHELPSRTRINTIDDLILVRETACEIAAAIAKARGTA
jgi:hypothetical protein